MNNAAADFFASLPSEKETEPNFNLMEPTEKPAPVEEEPVIEEVENREKPLRSERRAEKNYEFLRNQLQEEREARIRLEEQVKANVSTRKTEADPDIKRLLTEVKDPEEASQIFESLLSKVRSEAETSAFERYKAAQAEGDEETNQLAQTINEKVEAIEDKYGVDLTSDKKTRGAFLDFVNEMSDPDSDALPNMDFAWRQFQKTMKAPAGDTARKSQISSRSMTRSSTTRPEGKNIQPMTFDALNRGNFWENLIGGK